MNIFPVQFFRLLIEKKWQMLNKKASNRTNIFFDKKLEDEEKKVDWEKGQNNSQGLWFEAC